MVVRFLRVATFVFIVMILAWFGICLILMIILRTLLMNNHSFMTLYCAECGHCFKVPTPCRNRFCSVCSAVRFNKIRKRLDYLFLKQQSVKNQQVRFLTLTIKNQKNLSFMVKSLQKSFRRLRQRSFWKRKVAGGAFVIEVTYPDGLWHAHIHAVICGDYVPFKKLLSEWQAVSIGRGVYIQKLPANFIRNYLVKYITKKDKSLTESTEAIVSDLLKGVRLFQPFGSWHGWLRDYVPENPECPECGSRKGYLTQWEVKPGKILHGCPWVKVKRSLSEALDHF